ncbi:hypothetical protein B7486_68140, partial [cyanobacterium TDX16]
WTPEGYRSRKPLPHGEVEVLTPEPIVAVLRAGFVPDVHDPARDARRGDDPEAVDAEPAGA